MAKRDESVIDQVADIIRERIKSGAYGDFGALPSNEVLGEELGYNRFMVGEAMSMLRSEGLLRFEKHRYVVENIHLTLPGIVKNFEQWLRDQGYHPVMENVIQPEISEMDKDTAELFDVTQGFRTVHRIRKQSADKIPLRIAENWYPADLAEPLLEEMTNNPNMDVIGTIKERTGLYIVETVEETIARIPNKKEREMLRLYRYQPVLETLRINLDQHGNPIMFNRILLVGTKFKLTRKYSVDHWS